MTKSIFLAIFIAITMSIFLFYLKYEVASLEDESQRLNKQILSQKQRIHVLRSEWSRLNDWKVNPFKPTIKGKNLIGRGANDMKASVACFISAVSKFKSKKTFKIKENKTRADKAGKHCFQNRIVS